MWHIVLENESESASFGASGTYLNQLTHQGVYLADYYATGHASLDNYIAKISGQAPTEETSADCGVQASGSSIVGRTRSSADSAARPVGAADAVLPPRETLPGPQTTSKGH